MLLVGSKSRRQRALAASADAGVVPGGYNAAMAVGGAITAYEAELVADLQADVTVLNVASALCDFDGPPCKGCVETARTALGALLENSEARSEERASAIGSSEERTSDA